MAREERRAHSGPVSPGPPKFRGVLFYRTPKVGEFKARFTHYATLKEAQADTVEVECYGRPNCFASLKNLPRLAELLQKTAHAIPREIAELEVLLAAMLTAGFGQGFALGAETEKKRHIEIIIDEGDDPEGV